MAQPLKNQAGIPWMTPDQAADFLKQIRESKSRGRRVNQTECIDALERPKADKKADERADLLGM